MGGCLGKRNDVIFIVLVVVIVGALLVQTLKASEASQPYRIMFFPRGDAFWLRWGSR